MRSTTLSKLSSTSVIPAHVTVSWVDVVIAVVVVLAVLAGCRRGGLVDAATDVGHLGGAFVGFASAMSWVVPRMSSPVPAWVLLAALTIGGAAAGGAVGRAVTARGWSRPGGISSLAAGALAGAVSLGACWAVVQVAADLGPAGAAKARSRSAVITALDRADPAASEALGIALDRTGAPTFRSVHVRDLVVPSGSPGGR